MNERRRAIGFLGARDIARLLNLPDDVHVVGVRDDFIRDGVLVMLESESFDPVPVECEPPRYVPPLLADLRHTQAAMQGGGPDYTDLTAWCPAEGCPWDHEWNDTVALGEVVRVVGEHLAEAHPE